MNRVLYAEDNETVRRAMAEALSIFGYKVTDVADGAAALERVGAAGFDIVLTDHDMPRVNGLELLRELRARGYAGRSYVLSGNLSAETRRAYEALRVDGIALKPVEFSELRLMLSARATA